MPIFEYTCDGCSTTFEQLVRSTTRVACPSCGSREVAKRFSVPAPPVAAAPASAGPCAMPMSPGPCCGGGGCSIN